MPRYILIYVHPETGEQQFELEPNRVYYLGSKEDNNIVIPQHDVSRRHAMLSVREGTFHVTDLNSKNGTFLNGSRVASATLTCGDQLGLSSARLVILEVSAGAQALAPEIHSPRMIEVSGDHREETGQYRGEATAADMVRLLQVTAAASRQGAPSAPLAWCVEHLGIEGVMVLYRDDDDSVGMVASAGDLGRLIENSDLLSRIASDQQMHTPGRRSLVEVQQVGEKLMVAPIEDYVVLVRYRGDSPAVGDVQALVAAEEAVLARVAASNDDSGVSGSVPALRQALHRIVGTSSAAERLRTQVRALARRVGSVLISGEPGAGKALTAQTIHAVTGSARRPYVVIDCVGDRVAGAVRQAFNEALQNGTSSTLVIDDVLKLTVDTQLELMQMFAEWASPQATTNGDGALVRILVLASDDVSTAIADGRLLPELRDLLSDHLQIPPLRERIEDVPLLISTFLRAGAEHGDCAVGGLTVRALDALMAYDWPGNVRELRTEVERLMVAVRSSQVVDIAQLSPHITGAGGSGAVAPVPLENLFELSLDEARAVFERWMVEHVLDECSGNQTAAAQRLGLSRAGLFKKLRRLRSE